MISIAMQLGLEPKREKLASGVIHTADGKPPKIIHKRTDRKEAITERRMAILAICSHEAVTMAQLKEALEIKEGTLAADLRAMVQEGTLRMFKRRDAMHWEATKC